MKKFISFAVVTAAVVAVVRVVQEKRNVEAQTAIWDEANRDLQQN